VLKRSAKKMTETLTKLWALTESELSEGALEWNDFFDPIGLILLGKLENLEYWCTPTNSITFASTGGDGVHYGLLRGQTDARCADHGEHGGTELGCREPSVRVSSVPSVSSVVKLMRAARTTESTEAPETDRLEPSCKCSAYFFTQGTLNSLP